MARQPSIIIQTDHLSHERDQWLEDKIQAHIDHRKIEREQHRVTLTCSSHYEDGVEQESYGEGSSYEEALFVALRNWQSRYGSEG